MSGKFSIMKSFIRSILFVYICSSAIMAVTVPDTVDHSENRFGMIYSYGQDRRDLYDHWDFFFEMNLVEESSVHVKELGTGWTREVSFMYTEGAFPGDLFGYSLEKIEAAKADGLKIIATILAEPNDYYADPNAYKDWLAVTLSNCGEDFDCWQIHNEVGKSKDNRFVDPNDYLDFLEDSYEVFQAVCPDCNIMMGSMIPDVSYYTTVIANGDWMVDVYDIHFYQESEIWHIQNFASLISKPLFITEMGTYSGDPNGPKPYQSEDEQATTLIKWFVQAYEAGADYVFWTTMVEFYEFLGEVDGGFDFYGLVYNGMCDNLPTDVCNDPNVDPGANNRKEAYYALQTLIKHIDGFESVEKLQEGKYKFMVDGKPVYVVWCPGCDVPGMTECVYNDEISFYKEKRPGDIVEDCSVDYMDLDVLASQWIQPPGSPSADIHEPNDGIVNFLDLSILANDWLVP